MPYLLRIASFGVLESTKSCRLYYFSFLQVIGFTGMFVGYLQCSLFYLKHTQNPEDLEDPGLMFLMFFYSFSIFFNQVGICIRSSVLYMHGIFEA